MSKHTVHWVNDHTEICDRLDERVKLMEDYLDSKSEDFDGVRCEAVPTKPSP